MSIWHEILFRPLFNVLIFIYNIIPGQDMGIAIIALTIIIRLILYPSQQKALIAQKKMRDLQPELKKIQEKYKNDKQKQAKAQLEFYQTHKVNPLSGCLPSLIQLPIIIALYQVFRTGLDTSRLGELYSFIPKPETIDPTFLGYFNLAEPDRFILPMLAGITQFIQSKMMMPKIESVKGKSSFQQVLTQQMVYMMPIMIVIFAMSLPAALPLYWIVIALFGILQQYLINKQKTTSSRGVKISIKKK